MGASWSQSEAWQAVVTKDQVQDAVRGFEAWQKAQEEIKASMTVQRSAPSTRTLLDRVGGCDTVRRIVGTFCHKLYADEQLAVFLKSTDITSLRAKQSNFMCWLFSPSDQPNVSRHVRTAHLRLIKRHGFTPEHFDAGLAHFEAALREHGLNEPLVKEVMGKIRPYKDLTFTPLARDAEDEKRWAIEEYLNRQRPSSAASTASSASMSRPSMAQTPMLMPPPSPPPSKQQQQQQQWSSPGEADPRKPPRPPPAASASPSTPPLPSLQLQEAVTASAGREAWRISEPPSPSSASATPTPSATTAAATAAPSPTSTASFAAASAASDSAAAAAANTVSTAANTVSTAAFQQLLSSGSEVASSPSPRAHSASYGDVRAGGLRVSGGGAAGPGCPFTGARLSRPATSASELPNGVVNAGGTPLGGPSQPLAQPSRPPVRLVSSGPTTPPGGRVGVSDAGGGGGGGGGSGPPSIATGAHTPLAPLSLPPLALPPLAMPPLPLPPLPPLPSARSSVPSSGHTTPYRRSVGQPGSS